MEELKSIASNSPTARPASPDPRAENMNIQLGYNVCYIVCGVVIEDGKVLMIQEAKPSCRGQWYLPAGRMEKNESIVTAVKREVLEEAGLDFEPEALVAVEYQSFYWIRFTLTGHIAGGSLKTPAQADKESIQAGWFPADKQHLQSLGLRAYDCLRLVEVARDWYKQKQRPFTGLPVQVGHVSSSLRLVVVHKEGSTLRVLMQKEPRGTTSFPTCLLGSDITTSVQTTLKACGYTSTRNFKTVGVLSMEHLGSPCGVYDGFCLSLVVLASSRELGDGGKLSHWVAVEEEASLQRLRTAVSSDFGCARIIDLW